MLHATHASSCHWSKRRRHARQRGARGVADRAGVLDARARRARAVARDAVPRARGGGRRGGRRRRLGRGGGARGPRAGAGRGRRSVAAAIETRARARAALDGDRRPRGPPDHRAGPRDDADLSRAYARNRRGDTAARGTVHRLSEPAGPRGLRRRRGHRASGRRRRRPSACRAAAIETFAGAADAERFDATGAQPRPPRAAPPGHAVQPHGPAPGDGLVRGGAARGSARDRGSDDGSRATTLAVVDALVRAGGHFINRFGRVDTEEFARWRGPEPRVADLMKH